VLGEDVVVQQRLAAADAVGAQLPRREPVEQLLHRDVALDDPPVPDRPLQVAVLELLGGDGLGHREQGERQVGKRVAVKLHGVPLQGVERGVWVRKILITELRCALLQLRRPGFLCSSKSGIKRGIRIPYPIG
jgi:hypothetical protein